MEYMKLNCKKQLETLFKKIFTANKQKYKIIFNKMECIGNLAKRCAFTSFLVHILNKVEAKGSEDSYRIYKFVIEVMCDCLLKLKMAKTEMK